jgi:hypothetical protein
LKASDDPVSIDDDDAVDRGVDDRPKAGLAFPEPSDVLLSRGDIPRDCGCADDPASGVLDRRDGQGDVKAPSVLRQPEGLVVLDPLATNEACHDVDEFIRLIRRDQDADRSADDFPGRVAIYPLGGTIPRQDRPV